MPAIVRRCCAESNAHLVATLPTARRTDAADVQAAGVSLQLGASAALGLRQGGGDAQRLPH